MCTNDRIAKDSRLLCGVVGLHDDPACTDAVAQAARTFHQPKESPVKTIDASFAITTHAELSAAKHLLPKMVYGSRQYMTVTNAMLAFERQKLQAGRQDYSRPQPRTAAEFARDEANEQYLRHIVGYSQY